MIRVFLFMFVSGAMAQTIEFKGRNDRFALRVRVTDLSGEGIFRASQTRLDDFHFQYLPNAHPRVPRELHLVDIFGGRRIELGPDDVSLANGVGLIVPSPEGSGYFLRFELGARARKAIARYTYLGIGTGGFGAPTGPHQVLILNDERDYEDGNFRVTTWHRLDVGDRVFLEPLLECERTLISETP